MPVCEQLHVGLASKNYRSESRENFTTDVPRTRKTWSNLEVKTNEKNRNHTKPSLETAHTARAATGWRTLTTYAYNEGGKLQQISSRLNFTLKAARAALAEACRLRLLVLVCFSCFMVSISNSFTLSGNF